MYKVFNQNGNYDAYVLGANPLVPIGVILTVVGPVKFSTHGK